MTLRCRAWTCDLCKPLRRSGLIAQIEEGLPERLLTLTTRPEPGISADAEAYRLGVWFAALMRRVKRRYPHTEHAYFVVREAHKSGWPHLHVCLRGPYLPWPWLKAQWKEISGSHGVDIQRIYNPAKAGRYVAKYVGKNPHRFGTCKRYWCSRNWSLRGRAVKAVSGIWSTDWTIVPETVGALALRWWMQGYELEHSPSLHYREGRRPP